MGTLKSILIGGFPVGAIRGSPFNGEIVDKLPPLPTEDELT